MWTSVARSRISSAMTRAKASSLRKFSTRDYTIKEMLQHLDPYCKSLSLIGVALVAFGGAICYVEGLKLELALSKIEAEKQMEIAKIMKEHTANQMEVTKEHTANQIERAEIRTMERFLKFGYAEEFARYQKAAGVYRPEGSDN